MTHYKMLKWEQDMGEEICGDIVEFGKMHSNIYALTNVPKYRSFQYRVLQRGIVTNVQLESWKIIPSNLCSFCKEEEETVLHLFIRCRLVKELWLKVLEYMDRYFHVEGVSAVVLSEKAIITNTIWKERSHIMNFICLIVKFFIYRQRCCKQNIHFGALEGLILEIERTEKYIATKNGKLAYHNKKWRVFCR